MSKGGPCGRHVGIWGSGAALQGRADRQERQRQGDAGVGCPEPASPGVLQSVNEVLESMESPLELVEGFVGSIEVAVPWAALLTDHCTILVSGLQLTLQPRHGPGEDRVRLGQEWESQWWEWAWALQLTGPPRRTRAC